MENKKSYLQELTSADIDKLKPFANKSKYKKDEMIFAEGDTANDMYFIESGRVLVSIQNFTEQKEICQLSSGSYFGEMAFFLQDKRTATVTALEDTILLTVSKNSFMDLVKNDKPFAYRVDSILAKRSEELLLKETIVNATDINNENLSISIKGDPSLRETSFIREKYESVVDPILCELQPKIEELLTNRDVYQFFLGFNSGEIRVKTIFDPFNEKVHQAHKLLDEAYLDRHFPKVLYEEKVWMLKRIYSVIEADHLFTGLDDYYKKPLIGFFNNWNPISAADIVKAISHLDTLRGIEDFYIRNFSIGIGQDAIRIQFNCDGAHYLSSAKFQEMVIENIQI